MGSYGLHTQLEPKLSDEEGEFFKTLVVSLEADLKEGEKLLESTITPASSAALDFMLGTVRMQLGDSTRAIKAYEQAIKKFPNFMRAYKNLGIAYIQADRLEDGVKVLIKGMELGGADGLSYGLLGYCYINQGLYSAALNAYDLAIAFDPNSKDWKLGKIRSLAEMQDYTQAAGLIKELIQEDSSEYELYLHLANLSLGQNKSDEAMVNLEIVRRMGKGSESSLFLLADIYSNRGMFRLAVDAYDEAFSKADDKTSRMPSIERAFHSFVEHGAWGDAKRLIDLVEARFGSEISKEDRLVLLNQRAEVELGSQNSEAAAATLETIIEEDPMNGGAILLLARYYWKLGEIEEAKFLFERAQNIEEVAASSLLQHGQMLVGQREFSEAAKLIRRSLDLDYQGNVADYLRAIEEAAQLR